jgi:hypothetical protein
MPSFDPYALPPRLTGVVWLTFRYERSGTFTPMPYVACVSIERERGPKPMSATFRYAYPIGYPGSFVYFEHFLPLIAAPNGYDIPPADTVRFDDRIVVVEVQPDGSWLFAFDGFVQIPEGNISGAKYDLLFQAQGVEIRAWDEPIQGRLQRDAFAPDQTGEVIWIDAPARFNPKGVANCTGDPDTDGSWDYVWEDSATGKKSPVFYDERFPQDRQALFPGIVDADQEYVRIWTVNRAAKYILAHGNEQETWVESPDFDALNDLLAAVEPVSDGGSVDPDSPSSFRLYAVPIADTAIDGMPWPDALAKVLQPHGFNFRFGLYNNGGYPRTRLLVFRERDNLDATFKTAYLQPGDGGAIDVAQNNVAGFQLARDASQVVNAWSVDSAPCDYEIGIVLAPGFFLTQGNDIGDVPETQATNPDNAADRDLYRLFVADEAGEGFYDYDLLAWVEREYLDFTPILGEKWIARRRPGRGPLISTDNLGDPRKPTLCLLTNYVPAPRSFWDGTGDVLPIKGSWELLKDRLGVRITASDLGSFSIGKLGSTAPAAFQSLGSTFDFVKAVADADGLARIYLLLTCVISGDAMIEAEANRQATSPTVYTVRRRIDGRDKFKAHKSHSSSFWRYNAGGAGPPEPLDTVRDDSPLATEYAKARRLATELPSFAGTVTINRITRAYSVGDRLVAIEPRLSLQSNVGGEHGEGPRFPVIVKIDWNNDGNSQSTTLTLDDRRSEGEPVETT